MKKAIFTFLSVFLLLACQQNGKEHVITNEDTQQVEQQYHTASVIPTFQSNKEKPSKIKEEVKQEDIWLKSLITDTPQEGRDLAMKMARKTIAAIQTDPEVRKKLRADYAEDTKQLISTAEVVAIEFQTVAQANNYWRDK